MYYSISCSTEKEIGRTFPQLHCLSQVHAHSLSAWEFPHFIPKLIFELHKSAKLTDVLSDAATGGNGFIISKRLKDILASFTLMTHRYYDVKINTKNGELIYYFLHLCEPGLTKQLDYNKTEFHETNYTFRENRIKIESYERYKSLKSLDKDAKFGVDMENIFVKEDFNQLLDLFTFLPFTHKIFISEKLKNTIQENKITGLKLTEAPQFRLF